MSLIRSVSIALVLGFAVATTASPASAFFFHKHHKVEMTHKHPIHDFFAALFHKK